MLSGTFKSFSRAMNSGLRGFEQGVVFQITLKSPLKDILDHSKETHV